MRGKKKQAGLVLATLEHTLYTSLCQELSVSMYKMKEVRKFPQPSLIVLTSNGFPLVLTMVSLTHSNSDTTKATR